MYTLNKTLVREKGTNGRWLEIDASNLTLLFLFNNYHQIYLILNNSFLENIVSLDLNKHRTYIPFSFLYITVNEWLLENGNKSLPTSDTIPSLKTSYVTYSDALQANYSLKPVSNLAAYDSQLPNSEKEDLLVTKEGLNYSLFNDYGLVSVNGYFHLIDTGVDGVHVIDGNKTRLTSNDVLVGIYNFQNIGKIKRIPITRENISGKENNFKSYVDLHLGESQNNRTVFLVIGGYLHTYSNWVKNIGDGLFRIDIKNFPLIERFFESKEHLDLSSLYEIMTEKNNSYDQLDLEEVFSDEWITRYLTLSQSFFIVIENDDVFVDYHALEKLPSPGRFLHHEKINLPVIFGLGRILEYHLTKEDNKYLIAGQNSYTSLYNFNTTDWENSVSIDPSRSTIRPVIKNDAFILKIGTDIN